MGEPKRTHDPGYHGHHTTPNKRNPLQKKQFPITNTKVHQDPDAENSNDQSRSRTTRVAAPLVALHVAAHGERLPTAGVGAAEGLLARVGVGVDAQRGRAREGLVAGAADVAVVVLLVLGCGGGREVVVVLPGGSDGRDEWLLDWHCWGGS